MKARLFSVLLAAAMAISAVLSPADVSAAGAPVDIAVGAAPQGIVYLIPSNGQSFVDVYRANFRSPQLLRKIVDGISDPTAIFVDRVGQVYVANATNSSITVYARGQSVPLRTIALPVGFYAYALTVGTKGAIFVSGTISGHQAYRVIEFSSTGVQRRVIYYGSSPNGLATDSKGNLFVAYRNVLVFAPGSTAPFHVLRQQNYISAIAMNAADELVVDFQQRSVIATEDSVSGQILSGITAPGVQYFALDEFDRAVYATTGSGPLEYFNYRNGKPLGLIPGYYGAVAVDPAGRQ